mgnify:CR=1 FL=1
MVEESRNAGIPKRELKDIQKGFVIVKGADAIPDSQIYTKLLVTLIPFE